MAAADFLVTGATGFVGRHLVPRLAEEGTVAALVRPGARAPDFGVACQVLHGDLATPNGLRGLPADATVVHLAGEASPARCERFPAHAFNVNVLGTRRLLAATTGRLVFVSTGQVYGPATPPAGSKPTRSGTRSSRTPSSPVAARRQGQVPRAAPLPGRPVPVPALTEESPADPRNLYAITKRAAELDVLRAGDPGRETVVVRPFNMYGPGQTGPYLVPTVTRAVHAGRDVRIRVGSPLRDFTYIEDAADLFVQAATSTRAAGGVFNLCSGRSVPIGDVARTAVAVSGKALRVTETDPGRKEPDVRASSTKARRLLRWRATTPLREGLRRTLHWLDR